MATELSPATQIGTQLTRARRQIKFADLTARMLLGLLAAMLFLMAAVAIDHWVGDIGVLGRWLLLLAFTGGALWYTVRHIAWHALRAINPVYAARLIEHAEPSLRNGLINYLLLRQQPAGVHDSVLRTIENRAAADVSRVDPAAAADFAPAIKWGYALAAVAVLVGAYTILSPKDPLPSVQRLLTPWADIPRPARVRIIEVLPGDAIAFLGDTIAVAARLEGARASDAVELVFNTEDGQTVERRVPMEAAVDGRTWSTKLPPGDDGLRQSLAYRVEAGDAVSPVFQLTATAAPRILVERVEYDYPAHTKRPRRIVDHQGDLNAWEGSKVTLTATANQPIRAAWLEFDPASDGGPPTPADRVLHLKVNGQTARQTFTLELAADRAGPKFASYVVRFETPDGKRSANPILHRIEVLPDVPPEVEILAPADSQVRLPEDGRLAMEIRAVDPDFGLAYLAIDARGQRPQASFQHKLFSDSSGVAGPVQRPWNFVPSEHGLRVGDQLRLVAVARDNRPQAVAAIGEIRSRELIVLIVAPEKTSRPGNRSGNDQAGQPADKPQTAAPSDNAKPDQPQPEGAKPAGQPPETGNPPPPKPKNESSQATDPENTKAPKDGGQAPDKSASKSESGKNSGQNSSQPKRSDGKQSDGKQSDGKQSDGKQSDGKQSDGKQSDGKQSDGKQSDGKQSDGKQSDGKQSDGKQSDGKQSDGKQSDGKQSDGKQSDGKQSDGKQSDGKQSDGKQSDGKQSGGKQSGGKQPVGKPPGDEQAADSPPEGDQSAGGQSEGKPSEGNPSEGKPSEGKPSGGQSSGGQPKGGQQSDGKKAAGDQAGGKQSGGDQTQKSDGGLGGKPQDTPAGSMSDGGKSKPAEDDGEAFERAIEFLKERAEKGREQQGSPDSKPESNMPTDAAANDSQGGKPSPSARNNSRQREGDRPSSGQEPEQKNENRPQVKPQGNPQGSAGQSGAGQASKDQAAPPDSPDVNGDRDKKMLPANDKSADQKPPAGDKPADHKPADTADPPAPSDSERQSDSQGGAEGEKSGGGKRGGDKRGGDKRGGDKRGGGQGAKQAGNDTAGRTSASDDGAGQATEKGQGDTSGRVGDQARGTATKEPRNPAEATPPTGPMSGAEKSQGAEKTRGKSQSGGSDPNSSPSDNRAGSEPDPDLPDRAGRTDPPSGDERRTGGGGVAGNPPASRRPPAGPVAEGDDANLDYANRATDLVLDYLKDQKESPNQELLEQLGWTADDLRKFVNRWEALKRAANEPDPASRRELSDSLRSLGLRPATDRRRSVNATNDAVRGNLDAGGRSNPPAKYQERFNAYRRGAGQ